MLLDEIKAYALSNDDINDILDPPVKIIPYPRFNDMRSIDEAFDNLGRCVFLFLTQSESSGHWVCMFKRNATDIEYFSSYGDKPEAEREWISQEQLDSLGQGEPYLMRLLKDSGYRVYYNTYSYQKDKQDVNTCGRWVTARLICKDMSNQQFYNLVRDQMKDDGVSSPDDWVALFTYNFLGK